MRTLKDAWFMIRGDFSGNKMNIVGILAFSIFMVCYLSFFTGMLMNGSIRDGEQTAVVDFMMLSMIPVLGFTYSRRSIKYLRNDSYTKMLAYLRSLPIPTEVILYKKKLEATLSLAVNGILYFGLVYGLGSSIRAELSSWSYIAFTLTWIGFAFAVSGIYIAIEYLCNGKTYSWLTLLNIIICAILSWTVKMAGGNLFYYSVSSAKVWGLLSPIMWGTLLVGALSFHLFSRWILRRLEKRDLV